MYLIDFMESDQLPKKKRRSVPDLDEDFEDLLKGGDGSSSHSRKKRQAPYIIFPEILCIVDYDGYR